jgi:predicted Zn-dependent protease
LAAGAVQVEGRFATPANIDEAKAAAALGQTVEACRAGNPAEAERLGREWIGLATPRLLPAFCLVLAQARLQQGDAAEARGFCERGLAVAPEDPGLRCTLGIALLALGDRPGARREWEHAARAAGPAGDAARANLTR